MLLTVPMIAVSCSAERGSVPSQTVVELGALRARPLQLPVADGMHCPVTVETASPSADLGVMLGTAPARPVLGRAEIGIAPAENFDSELWGGQKVLWALSDDVQGPALIRGRRLDAPGEARFDVGPIPAAEKILSPSHNAPLDGGWFDFPGFVRLREPGCYGFQIDTDGGSWTVVLRAVAV